MEEHSDNNSNLDIRNQIIGLGEKSFRKSYFPEFQDKLRKLEENYTNLRAKSEELQKTIVELEKSKQRAEVNESKFRMIFDSSTDGILLYDINNQKVFLANHAVCRIFEIEVAAPGKEVIRKLLPESALQQIVANIVHRDPATLHDVHIQTATGKNKYLDITINYLNLESIEYVVGGVRDVTDVVESRKKERDLLNRVNQSHAVYLSIDPADDFRITDISWNARQLGLDHAEILHNGCGLAEIIFRNDLAKFMNELDEFKRTRTEAFEIETGIEGRNGVIRWVDFRIYAGYDDEGQFSFINGFMLDITRRRQYEEELKGYRQRLEVLVEEKTSELVSMNLKLQQEIAERNLFAQMKAEAEHKWHSIFQNINEGLYRMLPGGDFILANPAIAALLEIQDPDELTATGKFSGREPMNLLGLFENRQKAGLFYDIVTRQGYVKAFDAEIRNMNGKLLNIYIDGRAIKSDDDELRYIEGFVLDISERVRAQEALKTYALDLERSQSMLERYSKELALAVENLQKAKNAAESASKAKSEFLANMSHEIRTPLNAILGFAELLKDKIVDENLRGHLRTIHTAGNTLLSIINDILDLSKIESGKLEIHSEPVDIIYMIDDIREFFKPAFAKKGLELIVELSPSLPAAIISDEIRLRQIMFNIVGNAVKFTETGFVRIFADYAKGMAGQPGKLRLEVEDTGIGIASDQLDFIFEAFRQENSEISRQYGGTGLGLAITRKIVERLNGTIKVESTPAIGSKFVVEFPDVEETVISEAGMSTIQDGWYEFSDAVVLYADDVESNREVVSELLKTMNIDVLGAADGNEAIEILKDKTPDIVMLDLRMPGMSGIEAAEIIRGNPKFDKIPIVAISASTFSLKQLENNPLFDAAISKPVSKYTISELVLRFLPHKAVIKPEQEQAEETIEPQPEEIVRELKELKIPVQELVKIFRTEIIPKCEKFSKVILLNSVMRFSSELAAIGSEVGFRLLDSLGRKLNDAARNADVEKIKELLTIIPKIYIKIKENINEMRI